MRCYSLDTHLNSSSTYPGTVATSMYPVLNPAIYPQVTGHILSGETQRGLQSYEFLERNNKEIILK